MFIFLKFALTFDIRDNYVLLPGAEIEKTYYNENIFLKKKIKRNIILLYGLRNRLRETGESSLSLVSPPRSRRGVYRSTRMPVGGRGGGAGAARSLAPSLAVVTASDRVVAAASGRRQPATAHSHGVHTITAAVCRRCTFFCEHVIAALSCGGYRV